MSILARLHTTVAEMAARLDELRERGLGGWVEELAALHALQVQAQALLDMLLHIASELGYAPTSTREAVEALLVEGLLTREEADFIRRVAGFRNIVVHEYAGVDMGLVRRIVEQGEYRRVALLAAALLERARARGVDP